MVADRDLDDSIAPPTRRTFRERPQGRDLTKLLLISSQNVPLTDTEPTPAWNLSRGQGGWCVALVAARGRLLTTSRARPVTVAPRPTANATPEAVPNAR